MFLKKIFYFRVSEINECDGENDCHDYANCTNTVGSYNCTCNEGFEGNGINCIGTANNLHRPSSIIARWKQNYKNFGGVFWN